MRHLLYSCWRILSPIQRYNNRMKIGPPMVLFNRTPRLQQANSLSNYEGDGKTTVSFVDDEIGQYMTVQAVSEQGFILSNGAFAIGPIILLPGFIFRWKVKTIDDITAESLLLFKLFHPEIELVLLGIGQHSYWSVQSFQRLKNSLSKSSGLRIEILPTRDAVATYNFMLTDFRAVAGAFLPMKTSLETKLLEAQDT